MVLVVIGQQDVVPRQVAMQYVRAVQIPHSCSNLPSCDYDAEQIRRPQRHFLCRWQSKPALLDAILRKAR